jgi:protein-disulfide isomerase
MALTPPLDDARDHVIGPPDAPALVEYGDFECPYCGDAYPSIQDLLRRHGARFRFAFRHFPLDKHPHARQAALAAEAAAAQGRFWEMHDRLFEARRRLEPGDIRRYAQEVGLDLERFERDLQAPETAARVDADVDSGVRSGVTGTPTFFIQGERYDGFYDAETLADVLSEPAPPHP